MDLRLNATRRSINLSVYLVFDLEAGRFKFLNENLFGARAERAVENEPSTLDSFSYKRRLHSQHKNAPDSSNSPI